MTREKYESLPLATLKELAKARKMRGVSTLKKSELIDAMLALDAKEEQAEAASEAKEEVREEVRLWPPSQGRQARYGGGWSFVP